MRISALRILTVSVVPLQCVVPLAADSPLIPAVTSGDLQAARTLINQGADVDARDADGATSLFVAIVNKDAAMVELLLGAGASQTGVAPNFPGPPWARGDALSVALSRDADGTCGLVAALHDLTETTLLAYGRVPDIPFPAASSELVDSRLADRYSADKARDGTLETSWVEGVGGPGIGELSISVLELGVTERLTVLSIEPLQSARAGRTRVSLRSGFADHYLKSKRRPIEGRRIAARAGRRPTPSRAGTPAPWAWSGACPRSSPSRRR